MVDNEGWTDALLLQKFTNQLHQRHKHLVLLT